MFSGFMQKWHAYSRPKEWLTRFLMVICAILWALILWAKFFAETPPQATKSSSATQISDTRKLEARQRCRNVVQFSSQFPTKASFYGSTLDQDVDELPGGGFTVRGRVDLLNGLGAKIPHSFTCTIGADGKLKPPFSITPG